MADFPYSNLSDDEFLHVHTNTSMNEHNLVDLYNDCCDLNIEIFNHTEHCFYDFEQGIDADNNLFNHVTLDCSYYTDTRFNDEININDGLSIIHINCRSLSANFSRLADYLSGFNHMFDIIAVSETWLTSNSNPSLFNLPGYEFCHVDRKNKRGGGVAIYVNNNLNFEVRDNMCTVIDDVLECISVELFLPNKNVIISCLYRQPGSPIISLNNFLETTFKNIKSNLYICGDFNVNLLNYDNSSITRTFLDNMIGLGLFPLIDKPSRITRQSLSLTD